ncbi:MAG: DUF3256 family protein [Tannerella sp.]|jgi:hypothetical protein|nr:DUF3256 family protein [Tannerella sp.]
MKYLIISILMFCSVFGARAQTVGEIFVAMPDELIVQLEKAWRKDLVDLYKSGKDATLENTMQGTSTLKTLTDDYILLQTTERSTMEIRRLPLINNTYVVCVITTVYAPVADSRVHFYTTDWHRLSPDGIFSPLQRDAFLKNDADTSQPSYMEAMTALDICLVKYSLNADNNDLTAEYTTLQYLSEETRLRVKPFIKDVIKVYNWKSGHYDMSND